VRQNCIKNGLQVSVDHCFAERARVLPVSYPFSFTGQKLIVDGHNRVFD
jgi:hypothetical protein